jgi:hypothetical protein
MPQSRQPALGATVLALVGAYFGHLLVKPTRIPKS